MIDSIRPLCSRMSTTFRRLVSPAAVATDEREWEWEIRVCGGRELRREKEEVKERAALEEREKREKQRW